MSASTGYGAVLFLDQQIRQSAKINLSRSSTNDTASLEGVHFSDQGLQVDIDRFVLLINSLIMASGPSWPYDEIVSDFRLH